MSKSIQSIAELKELSEDNPIDIFIKLRGGLKSSKTITYHTDEQAFEIHNDIDDSDQIVPEKHLGRETIIIEALEVGALFQY